VALALENNQGNIFASIFHNPLHFQRLLQRHDGILGSLEEYHWSRDLLCVKAGTLLSIDLFLSLIRGVRRKEEVENVVRFKFMCEFHELLQVPNPEVGASRSEDLRIRDECLKNGVTARARPSDGYTFFVNKVLRCEEVNARDCILDVFDSPA